MTSGDLDIWTCGTKFSHNILVMLAICVHELNRIWAFYLDLNHLETLKVMTLTFDIENGNQPYFIKLWYTLYLNTKFDGCNLKAVYVASLYIKLL